MLVLSHVRSYSLFIQKKAICWPFFERLHLLPRCLWDCCAEWAAGQRELFNACIFIGHTGCVTVVLNYQVHVLTFVARADLTGESREREAGGKGETEGAERGHQGLRGPWPYRSQPRGRTEEVATGGVPALEWIPINGTLCRVRDRSALFAAQSMFQESAH